MYVVNLHSGTGSMAEAMDPQFSVTLSTKKEVKEFKKLGYAELAKLTYGDEYLFIVTKVKEPNSVNGALKKLLTYHEFDDLDLDEDEPVIPTTSAEILNSIWKVPGT